MWTRHRALLGETTSLLVFSERKSQRRERNWYMILIGVVQNHRGEEKKLVYDRCCTKPQR